jgi:hypothetical protein
MFPYKICSANEERAEKVNRVKIVEKDKGNLEASKIEAEECIKQEKEIIDISPDMRKNCT